MSENIVEGKRWQLDLGKVKIMGILNVTPDSFYDRGRYYGKEVAIKQGLKLAEEGADIIDIGGESSRPGAEAIPVKEELKRVIPVIENLSKHVNVPISIDTYKGRVAKEALAAGATMVNDISALGMDKQMIDVIQKEDVPVVLMHMQGTPKTMQINPFYKDVIKEIYEFLAGRIDFAEKNGVKPNKIIIDPGIGFGKTTTHNLKIIKNLIQFKSLGKPILLGLSRKSFIGNILNLEVEERLEGTLACVSVAVLNGVNILRVHNVQAVKRAIHMVEAIKQA